MQKAILLFSGGPDSTSAMYLLKSSRQLVLFTAHEPELTRNHSEVASARKIAGKLGLPHKVVNFASSGQLFDDVAHIAMGLGGGNRPGKGDLAPFSPSKVKCVSPDQVEAPFSLAFLHLSAAIYAAAHETEEVIWAVHCDDDIPIGWIAEYTKRFNALLETFGLKVFLSTPFVEYSKSELLAAGSAADAPLNDTFSCLVNPNGVHCGECHGCIERSAAFERIKVVKREIVTANVV